jgi:hypothetical protein
MVARFDFWSVSLAQNPKSAIEGRDGLNPKFHGKRVRRTDLDTTLSIKENIIRLDISMNDALAV